MTRLPDKCCFVLSLKTGMYMNSGLYFMYHTAHLVNNIVNDPESGAIGLIQEILLMGLCGMLFVATYRENVCLMFLTLMLDFTEIVTYNTAKLITLVLDGFLWYKMVVFFIMLLLDIYVIITIFCFYKEISTKEAQKRQSTMSVDV